jgi:hypothetical protein
MKFFIFYGEEPGAGNQLPPRVYVAVAPDEATAQHFLPRSFRIAKVEIAKQTPKIGTPPGLLGSSEGALSTSADDNY